MNTTTPIQRKMDQAIELLEQRFLERSELREQVLSHKKPDWASFYSLAQMAFGGGTHFD